MTDEDVEGQATRLLPQLERVWDDGSSAVINIDDDMYIQWAKWPEGLQVECSSDEFLPDDRKLTFVQRRALADLGFHAPSLESPNHWQRYYAREDLPRVAQTLARVIVDVLGHRPPRGDVDAPTRPTQPGILIAPLGKCSSKAIL